jgi:hypothetical protein
LNGMLLPWVTVRWGITPSSRPIMGPGQWCARGRTRHGLAGGRYLAGRRSFTPDFAGLGGHGLAWCAPTGRRSAVWRKGKTPSQGHRSTSGQRVGYPHEFSGEQNPERQLDGVEVDTMFTDSSSGKSTTRFQLQAGSM